MSLSLFLPSMFSQLMKNLLICSLNLFLSVWVFKSIGQG